MKALSIRGDYVLSIIRGIKTVEYRTWKTNYRGPVLICSTAKKVPDSCPSYALCVAMIKDIEWNRYDKRYEWHIEPFKNGGSYLIQPIYVKGQQRLFNVDDDRIKKAPYYPSNTDPKFINWWRKNIIPLIVSK